MNLRVLSSSVSSVLLTPNPEIRNRLRYSQFSVPPVWYSVTRVSKKFFSLLRSITSLIQGKGLVAPELTEEQSALRGED